ncbi:hypothetical protein SPI_05710 [Niveomyces insectorum RCEF 264]|uniref:Uncharacterized protein n=1 Tax=Niveomyces insectorum RCEF 264 TaxID=1081102 RepID=A0A167TGR2_9HYPO|nr:hypothetical protein SPI_05710 [Niveomyces insectorum RCEF 264]
MTTTKSASTPSSLPRPGRDAVSLHSQHGDTASSRVWRFLDDDDDDDTDDVHHLHAHNDDDALQPFLDDELPPLYADVVAESEAERAAETRQLAAQSLPRADAGGSSNNNNTTTTTTTTINDGSDDGVVTLGSTGGATFLFTGGELQTTRQVLEPALDDDPVLLARTVRTWADQPPRPFVRLRGTHKQTVDRGGGKKETKEVVDFDVQVDLTPYLYADARQRTCWRVLRTVDNRERVRRGTVFRYQAADAAGAATARRAAAGDLEGQPLVLDAVAPADDDAAAGAASKPSLEAWCRRYCADPSTLKAFVLRRRVTGFDAQQVRAQLTQLVQRTNYRGHLTVTCPVYETELTVLNSHRINRWRLSPWIRLLCIVTLLIVFTWPYLFFVTKRYEVARVDWPFSRLRPRRQRRGDEEGDDGPQDDDNNNNTHEVTYVSLSEAQWYNLWGRAIEQAVLAKRQGTLDQEDLRRAEGAAPTFGALTAGDRVLDYVAAGISAMSHTNRQFGWGGDC